MERSAGIGGTNSGVDGNGGASASTTPAPTLGPSTQPGVAAPPGPAGPPQLPPQMFTTSAQLLDLTDKKLLVSLRDGRRLIGVLRSWDQVPNLVLQYTVERLYVDGKYCDINRGVFLVRGENVLLLGEIDLDKEDELPQTQATVEEVFGLHKAQQMEKKRRDKVVRRKLAALGFEEDEQHVLF
ncbi:Sm-like ribonucleo protein [Ascobolus immersus RN42]|uniref:U6 snRNA-associated Sm-like protein LSm1 n=1 Tax=Ascobolus immersus RN42 TaxID=1160509 RepID=A0A3N4IPY5_ASCIM|nr:Sm-like ribonucleo protein [Ascobolus immersus RN42]